MGEYDQAMQDAIRLAQSPAGQQLLAMLQRSNGPQLRQAMAKAAAGEYEQAKLALSSLMDTPEAKQLLEQLGR